VPAKIQIPGQMIDANIDDALVVLTKEDLFDAARQLMTTEAHWLYIVLGQHLAGEYIHSAGRSK
jgi:hypothetical protein